MDSRWAARLVTALPLLVSIAWFGGDFRRTYGPTHYFLNYRHGFLKRALVGELLLPLHSLTLHRILVIEVAIFAALALAFYSVFRRMLFGTAGERAFAALLLAAPAVLPHFAYLSGDLDSILALLAVFAVGSFLYLGPYGAAAASLGLSLAALLVHEGFVLMFYPVLLAILLDQARRRLLPAAVAVAHAVIVAAAFLAVLHYGKWAIPHPEYLAQAQQRTDMPLEGTVFLVLSSTLTQQLHFVAALYTPRLVAGILLSCAVSLPYFAMLLWLLRRSLTLRGWNRLQSVSVMLLMAAPLLLLPLGHDAMRWVAAICVNATLLLLYLYSTGDEIERSALTTWTGTPLYVALLGYSLALGPFGIASNRLVSNLGDLLSRHP